MSYRAIAGTLLSLGVAGALSGCATPIGAEPMTVIPAEHGSESLQAIELKAAKPLGTILDRIAANRVVFVGETHDSYADHLDQLAVVSGLAERWPDMAIGMEIFQRPFQGALDDYVTGHIDEAEMLKRTEYFQRWRFDYRYYRPVLRFAREHHVPLVALNAPSETVHKLASLGLDGLDSETHATLPKDLGQADEAYRDRLKATFDQHPRTATGDFERFVQVQLLWDETMAETAADHLRAHPGRRMVVLAGSGHVADRSAIPDRLERRLTLSSSILLGGSRGVGNLGDADILVLSPQRELPAAGRIGIYMEDAKNGVKISRVAAHSAAERSNLQQGDLITALDGRPVKITDDVKIALVDRRPGDRIRLDILRDGAASVRELVLGGD